MRHFTEWLKHNRTHKQNYPFVFMLSMFALMLFFPVFTKTNTAKLALCTMFTLVIITSFLSVRRNRIFIASVLILAVPLLILAWLDCIANIEHPASDIAQAIMLCFFFVLLFSITVYKIVSESHAVTKHTIFNAISAYLLLGLFFAGIYAVLALCGVKVFSIESTQNTTNLHDVWDISAYFSYCSLTTLGLGDVTPASPVSRSLTTIESVIGPLYLSILIARLVSTYKNSHKNQD